MISENKQLLKRTGNEGPGWKMAFSGFILLLLCFFIMMNSLSTYQKNRAKKAIESFNKAIHITKKNKNIEKFNMENIKEKCLDKKREESSNIKNMDFEVQHVLGEGGIDTQDVGNFEALAIKVETPINFEPGSSEISPAVFSLLDKIGSVILTNNYFVHIKGYGNKESKEDKIYGNEVKISIERAINVLKYFCEETKIKKKVFSLEGSSEFYKKNEKSKIESQKNDIVEIILYRYE